MLNLLYLDDSTEDGEAALRDFRNSPFALHWVASERAAWEELGRRRFDIVVSDVIMAGEGGLGFARRFSALGLDALLILTSGVSMMSSVENYQGLRNYLGFIPKPITPAEILPLLSTAP